MNKNNQLYKITAPFIEMLKDSLPNSSKRIELLGLFILTVGVFIGQSLFSFQLSDLYKLNTAPLLLKNWGGPLGVKLSGSIFNVVGGVGFALPVAFISWGGLVLFGFISRPKLKRIFGFILTAIVFSGIFNIKSILLFNVKLPNGTGGSVGHFIGKDLLLGTFGHVGSLLLLTFAAISVLVLTNNITFSNISEGFYSFFSELKRIVKTKTHLNDILRDSQDMYYDNLLNPAPKSKEQLIKQVATKENLQIQSGDSDSTFKLDLTSKGTKLKKLKVDHFELSNIKSDDTSNSKALIEELTIKLEEFKIRGQVTNVIKGPVVTTYEFEPKAGTKISKIKAIEEDLTRLLKASSLRIVAPIPGKDTVGFEIPNKTRKIINFGNLVSSPLFADPDKKLPIAMGVDCFGQPVVEDLASMPHLLVAGATGSGKSVFINTLLSSLLVKHSPKTLRLVLFDPKMVELGMYNQADHLACEVINDPQKEGQKLLNALVTEMEERYKSFNSVHAKNMEHFNKIVKTKAKQNFPKFKGSWKQIPYVVVVIDEFADMMMILGKKAEEPITRLAQKARAAGIHLVIATQRPSAQVMTGMIKANFPTRVAFKVMSGIDSRTILDTSGAESLLGKGDMLYLNDRGMHRVHGGYINEEEIESLVQ